jgi:hypothetical protein
MKKKKTFNDDYTFPKQIDASFELYKMMWEKHNLLESQRNRAIDIAWSFFTKSVDAQDIIDLAKLIHESTPKNND